MCGRYNLRLAARELQVFFELFREPPEYSIRYNIAPTQSVPVIRLVDQQREAALLRWGLIPVWAKDSKIGSKMINARAETIIEKPTYRANFKCKRCLIPASGFYEWKSGSGKVKQPYHIHKQNLEPLAFAGMWDTWDKAESPIESCTIITTQANSLMKPLHDRMPVILPQEAWTVWLDPEVPSAALYALLIPYVQTDLVVEPVSTVVNNVRNDSPDCIVPTE